MNLRMVAAAGVWTLAILALSPLAKAQVVDPAAAQNTAAGSAGDMLRSALQAHKVTALASPQPSTATPRPGIQHPSVPGLNYTLDLSSQFSGGSTGYHRNALPGGIDATVFYGPDKYTRLQASYFEINEYPIGFDTGIVPSYVNNAAIPVIGPLLGVGRQPCANLTGINGGPVPNCPTNINAQQQDATTQDRVMLASISRMFYLMPQLPIVITPTYVSKTASIGGGSDVYLAWNPANSTYQAVHLRTVQTQSVIVTVPLANSPKFFAAFSIGPQWLVHASGLNIDNHAQLFELLDLRFFATRRTTIFVQPSILQSYNPVDPYSQRIPTLIAGISHKIAGPFFIQAFTASGTPTNPPNGNSGRIGVIDLTCVDLTTCSTAPNPRTNTAIQFGGFKAATFVLQLGIGTPSVIPL
jgi:hypothetical protein